MARIGISFIIVCGVAYAVGQTALPSNAVIAAVDWLLAHGYITGDDVVAGQVLARL